MSDDLTNYLSGLSMQTSLEECLDWNFDLVETLIGAWSLIYPILLELEKSKSIDLMISQLPSTHRNEYEEHLKKWLNDNYTNIVIDGSRTDVSY